LPKTWPKILEKKTVFLCLHALNAYRYAYID